MHATKLSQQNPKLSAESYLKSLFQSDSKSLPACGSSS